MNKKVFSVLAIIPLLFFCTSHAHSKDIPEIADNIKHFDKVDKNLYRGGQPDEKGLELLKKMGIKKVINFRYEKCLIEKERQSVEALGMEYINIPWNIINFYDKELFNNFFEEIKDKNKRPVFFHCKRGSERTGVIAAAYKIKIQGLSLEEAIKDSEKYNVKFIWRPFVNSKIKRFYEEFKKPEEE